MKNEKFSDLYKKTLIDPAIYPGALIKGVITNINNHFVTINSFLKSDGYIPTAQFKNEKNEIEIKIGEKIELVIESLEDISGDIKLSREKAKRIRAWEELENVYKNNKIITGSVIAKVKGGFTVKIDVIKAFLPGSLVSFRSALDAEDIKGKELKFKVIKLEKKKNNVVLSQKFITEENTGDNLQGMLHRLKEGNTVTGVIKNITDYGVFIDLGGIDGLLHITDMSWKRIKHPGDLVKIGNEIKVKILKFDKGTNRVSLGLKQLTKDPWDDIKKKYKENMLVNGTVTNITDYGCFVEIEEGIEGLVHLSEMDWTNKNINPKKIVKQGMQLKIIILDINIQKRRISLGIKQNTNNPWLIFSKKNKIGSLVKGTVKSITDFGIFIDLGNGVDGLIHITDISWGKTDNNFLLRQFKKLQIINSKILSIDVERERVGLGIKQLTNDPFSKYTTKHKKGSIVNCKPIQKFNDRLLLNLSQNVYGILKSTNKNLTKQYIKHKNKLILKSKLSYVDKKHRMIVLEENVKKNDYYKKLKNKHSTLKLSNKLI